VNSDSKHGSHSSTCDCSKDSPSDGRCIRDRFGRVERDPHSDERSDDSNERRDNKTRSGDGRSLTVFIEQAAYTAASRD
jgi:hypothetical protein